MAPRRTPTSHKRSLSEDLVFTVASSTLPSTPSSSTPTPSKKPKVDSKPIKHSPTTLRKLALLASTYGVTPFPDFARPTAEECKTVHDLLSEVHGTPKRPFQLVDLPGQRAGCGESPNVLDALVRTILSQNTTSSNSTKAKNAMDAEYGRANYRAVLNGGDSLLETTIRSGGLAGTKSKCIMGVLRTLDAKEGGEGTLDLQYLHQLGDREVMETLVAFEGVGVKTAACVLLFSLGRDCFAVDTHVLRISQSLGWLPDSKLVSRDTAFSHLDLRIPKELKYGLHSLMVSHGRGCEKCAANGVTSMDHVDRCPIESIVKRSKGKGLGTKAGGKGKKATKKEVEKAEEEAIATAEAVQEDIKLSSTPSPSKPLKEEETDTVFGPFTSSPSKPSPSRTRSRTRATVKEELPPTPVSMPKSRRTTKKEEEAGPRTMHGLEVPANE